MIDVETDVFSFVDEYLREQFPSIDAQGEYTHAPASFPHVSIEEKGNATLERTQTQSPQENHVSLMYETNVYSNHAIDKKGECRRIASRVDEAFQRMGFTRTMMQPTPNIEYATIYRITMRHIAVVSKEKVFYRR